MDKICENCKWYGKIDLHYYCLYYTKIKLTERELSKVINLTPYVNPTSWCDKFEVPTNK